VVGEVAKRRCICDCPILNLEGVVFRQGVTHFHIKVPGPSFLSVRIPKLEQDRIRLHILYRPHNTVESDVSSMKSVPVVIGRQHIFLSVKFKSGTAKTIGHPSHGSAEKAFSGAFKIFLKAGVAHSHVSLVAIPIRHHQCQHTGTEVSDSHLQTASFQGIYVGFHSFTSSFCICSNDFPFVSGIHHAKSRARAAIIEKKVNMYCPPMERQRGKNQVRSALHTQ